MEAETENGMATHELIDNAPNINDHSESGWAAIAKSMNEVDKQKIGDYKEDIDTILVFAGLYSAVLSALLAISVTSLQPDQTRITVLLLAQLVVQTHSYTITTASVNSTIPPMNVTEVISGSFTPTLAAKRVNILWFASLTLSLTSASFGILVKQWLREYLAGDQVSPQARLRIRHFRQPGLEHWHVFGIAAFLPLVLQISLALFFVGLCFFTLDADTSVGYTVIPLVGGWALLFVAATFAPSVSPRCPYKTPLLKSVMKFLRFLLFRAIKVVKGPPDPPSNTSDQHNTSESTSRSIAYNEENAATDHRDRDITSKWTWRSLSCDEEDLATDPRLDVEILAAVDKAQTDDQLVIKMCRALHETHTAPDVLVSFVYELLNSRLNRTLQEEDLPLNLEGLSVQMCTALMDVIAEVLGREVRRYPLSSTIIWTDQMKNCMKLLTARLPCLLSDTATETLVFCFNGSQVQRLEGVVKLLFEGAPRERLYARCLHLQERLHGVFMHLNAWQSYCGVYILLRDACCTCNTKCINIGAIFHAHKDKTPAVLFEHSWELSAKYLLAQIKKNVAWGDWHNWVLISLCHVFLNDRKEATWRDLVKELAYTLVVQPKYAPHIYRHFYHHVGYDSVVTRVCTETFTSLPEDKAAVTNLNDCFSKYVDDMLKKPYLLDKDFYMNILNFIGGQFPQMQNLVKLYTQSYVLTEYLTTYRQIGQTAHEALSGFHRMKMTPTAIQIDMTKRILNQLDWLDQRWLRDKYNANDTKYDPETQFVEWAQDFKPELSFFDDNIVRDIAAFIPDDEARAYRRVKRLRWLDGKEDIEPVSAILDERQLAIAMDEAAHADGNGDGQDGGEQVLGPRQTEENKAGVGEAEADEVKDGNTDVRGEVDGDEDNHHAEQTTNSTAEKIPDVAVQGAAQKNTHEIQDDDPPSDRPPDTRDSDGGGGYEA